MNGYEKIPDLQPNKAFPMNDVMESRLYKKADMWLNQVTEMEGGQFLALLKSYNKPTAIDGVVAQANHKAAVETLSEWDKTNSKQRPWAAGGHLLASAFNHQVRLLPVCKVDLTPELDQMKNDQSHLVREFSEFAWQSMEQHPGIHGIFQELLVVGRAKFDLDEEEGQTYFKAGLALPYLFAVTERLHGYTPDFTSMADASDPNRTEFRHLFTTAVGLAPEDRSER